MTISFDNLFVRLNPAQRGQKWIGKQVYSYDTKTAMAQPYSPSLIKTLWDYGKNIRYYRVSAQEMVTCAPIEVTIQDTAKEKHMIEVVVVIKRIIPERTADFIEALARHGQPPFEAFASYIGDWIQDFVNQKQSAKIDIITRFSPDMEGSAKSRRECVDYCVGKAEKILGLELTCEIRLPEADLMIDPISLKFDIFTKDCEEELTTHIELNILPPEDERQRNLALQKTIPTERIQNNLKILVGQWFRNHCSLEQFCYKPAEVRVGLEKILRTYVEGKLARVLFNFRVACLVPFEKEFSTREDFEVTCQVEPGPIQIQVRHRILLERQDIAKFRSGMISNLEEWMAKVLERYTRAVLFGKKYVDIIVDFDIIQNEIKRLVSGDVERIGFKVMHLLTIPTDDQIRSCLEGVLSFETDVLSLKTKDSRVEFKLSVAAQVELKDLEKVRDFLRPGDFLREQFKHTVKEEVARIVRQFSPECLYLYFRDGTDGQNGRDCAYDIEEAPENQIKMAISKRLLEKFGTEVNYITLNEEPTELTRLFSAIRPPHNKRITMTVEPRGDMGSTMTFHFDYRIVSIAPDGWTEFQEIAQNCRATDTMEKAAEIHNAITDMLSRSASGKLEELPIDLLSHPNPDVKDFMLETGLDEAIRGVQNHFGLIIQIINFTRDLSQWDRIARERTLAAYEHSYERLQALRGKLSQRENELGPNDPEVQEIRNEVTKREEEIKKFDLGQNAYFKDSLKAINSQNWKQLLLDGESNKRKKGNQSQSGNKNDGQEQEGESDIIDLGGSDDA